MEILQNQKMWITYTLAALPPQWKNTTNIDPRNCNLPLTRLPKKIHRCKTTISGSMLVVLGSVVYLANIHIYEYIYIELSGDRYMYIYIYIYANLIFWGNILDLARTWGSDI